MPDQIVNPSGGLRAPPSEEVVFCAVGECNAGSSVPEIDICVQIPCPDQIPPNHVPRRATLQTNSVISVPTDTVGFGPGRSAQGVPIPPDQINVLRDLENPRESAQTSGTFGSTLNRFLYQPLEGRAVPELQGDRNCVVAVYWPLSDATARSTIEWCFTAL